MNNRILTKSDGTKYYINSSGEEIVKVDKPVLAWHFLSYSKKLAYGDRRPVKPGKVLSVPHDARVGHLLATKHSRAEIALCSRGLHASKRIVDAASYNRGMILCRVELSGWVSVAVRGIDNKQVATKRKVLWMIDFSDEVNRHRAELETIRMSYTGNFTDYREWKEKHAKAQEVKLRKAALKLARKAGVKNPR